MCLAGRAQRRVHGATGTKPQRGYLPGLAGPLLPYAYFARWGSLFCGEYGLRGRLLWWCNEGGRIRFQWKGGLLAFALPLGQSGSLARLVLLRSAYPPCRSTMCGRGKSKTAETNDREIKQLGRVVPGPFFASIRLSLPAAERSAAGGNASRTGEPCVHNGGPRRAAALSYRFARPLRPHENGLTGRRGNRIWWKSFVGGGLVCTCTS